MRKAEGAEHYITAADTHWRSDAELRAVAEVFFHTYMSLWEVTILTSHVDVIRGDRLPKYGCFLYGYGCFLMQ